MAKEQPPIHGGVEKMGGAGCVTGVRHSADDCRSVQGSFESGECAKAAGGRGLGQGVFERRAESRQGERGDDPRPALEDRGVDDGKGCISVRVGLLSRSAAASRIKSGFIDALEVAL